ncbi:MAG: hypothetical protein RLY70_3611 [Planctomycetota bacterium]|jgi:bacterioferritin (cytochrome b1)
MSSKTTNAILNRVIRVVNRTLPAYLRDARPWSYPGRESALETLLDVGNQQVETAERLSAWVLDNGGAPESGDFPLAFTSYTDLSVDYLVRESLRRQAGVIAALEEAIEDIGMVPNAVVLLQEALGEAKAHRDMLTEALSGSGRGSAGTHAAGSAGGAHAGH